MILNEMLGIKLLALKKDGEYSNWYINNFQSVEDNIEYSFEVSVKFSKDYGISYNYMLQRPAK